MTFTALIVLFALAGILFFVAAVRRLRRRRLLGGALHGATALVLILLSACAVLIAANLRTYQRLTFEQPAGELQLTRTGDREFNAVLTYPGGERANFALRGDEWQVDARLLKWHAFANLIGFDTAYRLERIGGRFARIEDERSMASDRVFAESAAARRPLGAGAPLPLVGALDRRGVRQRDLSSHGRRGAV